MGLREWHTPHPGGTAPRGPARRPRRRRARPRRPRAGPRPSGDLCALQGGGGRPAPCEELLRAGGPATALGRAAGPAPGPARGRPRRRRPRRRPLRHGYGLRLRRAAGVRARRRRARGGAGGGGPGGFAAGSGGLGYLPAPDGRGGHGPVLPDGRAGSGFRIHEVGRAEAERSPWRGRRFAFAAASAVSFAAIALGARCPPPRPRTPAATAPGAGDTAALGVRPVLVHGCGRPAPPRRGPQRRGHRVQPVREHRRGPARRAIGRRPPPFLHAAAPLTAAGPLPPGPVPGQLDLLAPLAGPLGTLPGPYASDPVPGSVAGPLPTAAPTTGIAAPPP